MNSELHELLRAEILCREGLRDGYHKQAIAAMPYMTGLLMNKSAHSVFTAQEGTVWVVAIAFEPEKVDLQNLEKYALAIYDLTGITWIRVAHESNGHSSNIMVTPGKLITSEKLGE